MQDNSNARQQVVDRIKQSTNILVTVSSNPSVDALSAALALTLIINKLDKHGTAVFSGALPPAINFLEPNKTFEHDVDSLRDFIIALDKDKADRLRYKVEDDVVRIFITPYRTTITEKDLQFSQGDFNVDMIVALGVEKRDDLDRAIVAHGRILHDAAVITINSGMQKSSLGSINWQDGRSSSLCEMLAGIVDVIKPGMLDQQISTALLTGIVAATERFSNVNTTPQVMTLAAQLMAAGANQQLIASNLQAAEMPVESTKIAKTPQKIIEAEPTPERPAGEMLIEHEKPTVPPAMPIVEEKLAKPPKLAVPKPELELPIAPAPAEVFEGLKEAIKEETKKEAPAAREVLPPEATEEATLAINAAGLEEKGEKVEPENGYLTTGPSWKGRTIQPPGPPSLGGSLSATSEEALEDKLKSESKEKNKKILTHDESNVAAIPPLPSPRSEPAAPVVEAPKVEPEIPVPGTEIAPPPSIEPIAQPVPPVVAPEITPVQAPTLEEIEQKARGKAAPEPSPTPVEAGPAGLEAARAELNKVLEEMPAPANEPRESIGAQPLPAPIESPKEVGLPEMPVPQASFGALPPVAPVPAPAPLVEAPINLPPPPPLPDFSQLPSLPPIEAEPTSLMPPQLPPLSETPAPAVTPPVVEQQKTFDPGQFKIPGQ